jgi:hypothetical protein
MLPASRCEPAELFFGQNFPVAPPGMQADDHRRRSIFVDSLVRTVSSAAIFSILPTKIGAAGARLLLRDIYVSNPSVFIHEPWLSRVTSEIIGAHRSVLAMLNERWRQTRDEPQHRQKLARARY